MDGGYKKRQKIGFIHFAFWLLRLPADSYSVDRFKQEFGQMKKMHFPT